MGVRATELRKGVVIQVDGDLLLITEYMHHTPGNLRAVIHVKLKSLKSGSSKEMRLNASESLEVAYLDKKPCEYLYKEVNGGYVFMDQESYEQVTIQPEMIAEQMGFVKENTVVAITFHDNLPIGIEVPPSVVLKVTEAEPAVRGNTATNVKKEVTLETGLKIKVPIHISVGDMVKVRTADSEFQGRSN